MSIFGFLVLCGTLYELKQQYHESKRTELLKRKSESDHYDVIGKKASENDYTSINKAYVHDEPKTNGDVSHQNGGEGIQNGSTKVELPAGYMHHKEGDQTKLNGTANGKSAETDTNHFVTVDIRTKSNQGADSAPRKRRDGKCSQGYRCIGKFYNTAYHYVNTRL